ncbi:hypothetical protein KM908_14475 [Alkalihalobacillus clausii]|uniref:hypothetical protein n=1 Tax=Shouchella clausii TaxID=79880 RepID=UPI001C237C6F|nr:hypothetical protein [Shouchella clausii]MBU8597348.1 hypothetical protein [Shouchella clausii]
MTKTHVIGGVTYKEVARMAKEGDKVVHVDDGIVTEVEDVGVTISGYTCPETGDEVIRISEGYYRVLEPIDPPPKTTTDELLEITANLTRRVFDLERENKKLRDDVTETLGTITDLLRKRDRRIDDVEGRLTEVTEGLLYLDDKRNWLSYRVNNIKKKVDEIDDKAEMLIDDVVLLDERTEGLC